MTVPLNPLHRPLEAQLWDWVFAPHLIALSANQVSSHFSGMYDEGSSTQLGSTKSKPDKRRSQPHQGMRQNVHEKLVVPTGQQIFDCHFRPVPTNRCKTVSDKIVFSKYRPKLFRVI